MSVSDTTYVLIPGAWQGGWAWTPVARRLRAAGARAVTVTLPGLGDGDDRTGLRLSDAIDHVVSTVTELTEPGRPVTLVGHSWGGYVVTGAAHRLGRDTVDRVVYYNAVVPEPGTAMVDENQAYAEMIRAAIDAAPDGTISVVPERVPILLPDATPDLSDLFFDLLAPQPGAYFTDALEAPLLTEVGTDVHYLLSENDQALARPGTEFAARLGLTPVMLTGGHQSMLTHPDEVTAALLKL
ncbi:hypothetical protein GCM10022223_54270 [Kineosporia mesophila]|uniref:AB hydrolase-1 domain-containing protein n=1 Tax=Kineosporia mesophila TaxID=566012 RepID=A0ABP7ACX2_9ACTN|nr:alpha/beta hydrolase [Kineosporia mesophila]MCD5352734.1 alpha/beta hydrolase [Kineosporia mesophila]